jgi:cell division protease FtsH
MFTDIVKRPVRETWLSSEHRTLSDLPPVLTPAERQAAMNGHSNGFGAPVGSTETPGDPRTQAEIDAAAEAGADPVQDERPPTQVIEVPDGGRVDS